MNLYIIIPTAILVSLLIGLLIKIFWSGSKHIALATNNKTFEEQATKPVEQDKKQIYKAHKFDTQHLIDGTYTVPAGVTHIEKNGFEHCCLIKTLIINKGLKSIGNNAFFTGGIKGITIPASVTTIGDNAFAWCHFLSEVTLNEGLQSIGNHAFLQTVITSITIPSTVTTIGDYAFLECRNLKEVTLNEGLESIGPRAFSGTGITSITIPASVTTIGRSAFLFCGNLKEVTLNEGLESIGNYAFSETGITSITIPASVTTIDAEAFACCESLKYIIVADGQADKIKNMLSDNQKKLVIEEKYYNKALSLMLACVKLNKEFRTEFINSKKSIFVNLVINRLTAMPKELIDEINWLAADKDQLLEYPLMQCLQSVAIPRIDDETAWTAYENALTEKLNSYRGDNHNTAVSSSSLAAKGGAPATSGARPSADEQKLGHGI